jgi:multidrug efflux pump subunit AcrA (membrane-fusion protein)
VPAAAVRSVDGRKYVFVVNDGLLERRAVATGGTRGESILIESGLGPGERVVIEGPADLVDGTRVQENSR